MNEQLYFNERKPTKTVSLSETQNRLLSVLLQAKNNDKIGLTRDMLTEILHLARTTIFDNLKILRKLRIVDKKKIHKEGRGRPPILWFVKDGKS